MLKTKEKGFTFLEVIIAIFVLVVGIVAAYLVSQTPIFYTQNSINRLTAAFLAQEGIEIVRNIRDENWIEGRDWNNGLTSCSSGCYGDYNDSSLTPDNDPPFLKLNDFFSYDSDDETDETKFKRKITIDPDGEVLHVKSIVEWTHKGDSYDIMVEDKLYNWGDNI